MKSIRKAVLSTLRKRTAVNLQNIVEERLLKNVLERVKIAPIL
jgi:hypothetical protein